MFLLGKCPEGPDVRPKETAVKTALAWLVVCGGLIFAFVHYGNPLSQVKIPAIIQPPQGQPTEASPATLPDSGQVVTVVSPLQQLMDDGKPPRTAEDRPAPAGKPNPNDHILPSPVGTNSVVVRKTFSLGSAVNFPFIIPAHAVSPRLKGTYRSFVGQQGVQDSEETADIDLLVVNEQQYTALHSGRPADAVFTSEPAHDQDINFDLPASHDQPVRYYLVFRNDPRDGKKIVRADFTVYF